MNRLLPVLRQRLVMAAAAASPGSVGAAAARGARCVSAAGAAARALRPWPSAAGAPALRCATRAWYAAGAAGGGGDEEGEFEPYVLTRDDADAFVDVRVVDGPAHGARSRGVMPLALALEHAAELGVDLVRACVLAAMYPPRVAAIAHAAWRRHICVGVVFTVHWCAGWGGARAVMACAWVRAAARTAPGAGANQMQSIKLCAQVLTVPQAVPPVARTVDFRAFMASRRATAVARAEAAGANAAAVAAAVAANDDVRCARLPRACDVCVPECARMHSRMRAYAFPNARVREHVRISRVSRVRLTLLPNAHRVGLVHSRMRCALILCIPECAPRWAFAFPNAQVQGAAVHVEHRPA